MQREVPKRTLIFITVCFIVISGIVVFYTLFYSQNPSQKIIGSWVDDNGMIMTFDRFHNVSTVIDGETYKFNYIVKGDMLTMYDTGEDGLESSLASKIGFEFNKLIIYDEEDEIRVKLTKTTIPAVSLE